MPFFSRKKKTDESSVSPSRSPHVASHTDFGIEGLEDISDVLDTQINQAANNASQLGVGLHSQFSGYPNGSTPNPIHGFGSSEDAPPVPYAPPSPRSSVTVVPDLRSSPSSPPLNRPLATQPPSSVSPEQLSFRATNTTPFTASPPPMPSGTRNPQYLDTTPSPGGPYHTTGSSYSDGGQTNPPYTRPSSPTDHPYTSASQQGSGVADPSSLSTPYGQQIRRPTANPAEAGAVNDWRQNYQFAAPTPSTPPTVIVSSSPQPSHDITPSPRSQTASPLGSNTSRSIGGASSGTPLQQNVSSEEEADQLTQRIKVVEKENVVLSTNLQHVCEENARITELMEKLQSQLNVCLESNPSAGLVASPSMSPSTAPEGPTSILASVKDPEVVKGWLGGSYSTSKTKETFRDLSIRIEQEFTSYRSTHASDNDEVRALLEEIKKANAATSELAIVIATTRTKGECAIVIKKKKDNAAVEREELAKFEAQKARQVLEQEIDALKNEIREHEGDNDSLNNSILELQKKISKSKDLTTDLQRRLEEANHRADTAEDTAHALQKELAEYKLQVEELKAELNENNSDDEAEADEQRKAAVAEAVAVAAADLAKSRELNEKERSAAATREKKLRADLEAAEASLEGAKAKLAAQQKAHTKDISTLEEKLKEASSASAATLAASALQAGKSEERERREDELWAAQEAAEAEIEELKEKLALTEKALAASQEEVHTARNLITTNEVTLSHLQQQMEAERRQSGVIEGKFIAAQEKMAKMDLIVLDQQQEIRSISPPKKGRDKTPSRTSRGASLDVGSISASRMSDLQVQLDHSTEENKKLTAKIDSLYSEIEEASKRYQELEGELATQKRFANSTQSALETEQLKSQMLEAAVRSETAEREKRRNGLDSPRAASVPQSPAATQQKKSMSRGGAKSVAEDGGGQPPGSPFSNTLVSPSVELNDSAGESTAQEIADEKFKRATDRYIQDLKAKDDLIKIMQTKLIDSQMLMAQMDGDKEGTVSLARFSTLEVANDSLKAELIERENEIKALTRKVESLTAHVESLERDAEEKDELLTKNEEALKEANDCLDTATKELARRDKVRVQEAEDLKVRLSKNSADAATQLAHVRNQLEEKSAEAAKAIEENKKLKAEHDTLNNSAKDKQIDQTNAILKKDYAAKVREVNQLQETIKSLREELDTVKSAAAASAPARGSSVGIGAAASVASARSRASPSPAPPTDAIMASSPSRLTNPPAQQPDPAASADLQQRYNDVLAAKVKSEFKAKRKITQLETVNTELEMLVRDLQTTVKRLEYERIVFEQEKLSAPATTKTAKAKAAASKVVEAKPATAHTDPTGVVPPEQYYRVKVELDKRNVEIKKLTQAITSQAEDYRELIKNLEAKVRSQHDALVLAKLTADPTNTLQLLNHNHPLVNSTPQRAATKGVASPTSTITFAAETPSPSGKRNAAIKNGGTLASSVSNLIPAAASPSAEAIRAANDNLNKDADVLLRKVAELEDTIDMLLEKLKAAESNATAAVVGDGKKKPTVPGLFLQSIDDDEEEALALEPSIMSSIALSPAGQAKRPNPPSAIPPSSNVSSRPPSPTAEASATTTKRAKKPSTKSKDMTEATGPAAAATLALQKELEGTKKENEVLLNRINALEDQMSSEHATGSELGPVVEKLKADNERLSQALAASTSSGAKPPIVVNGAKPHSRVGSQVGVEGDPDSPIKSPSQMNREISELKRTTSRSAHELLLAKSELSVVEGDLKAQALKLKTVTAEKIALANELEETREKLEKLETSKAAIAVAAPTAAGPAWLRAAKPAKVRTSIYDDPDEEEEEEGGAFGAAPPVVQQKQPAVDPSTSAIAVKALKSEIATLKQANAEALSELEDKHHNEMQRLRQEMSGQEAEYQEEFEGLQLALNQSEKTIAELKQQLAITKEELAKALAAAAAAATASQTVAASDTTVAPKSIAGKRSTANKGATDAEVDNLKAELEQKTKDFTKLKAAFDAYRAAIEDEEGEEDEEGAEDDETPKAPPVRKPGSPKGFAQPQQIKELTAANAKLTAEVASLTAKLKKSDDELKYAHNHMEFLEGTVNGKKSSLNGSAVLKGSGKNSDLEDAAELMRLTEELIAVKQNLAEHMAVCNRLGLKQPFNDPRLEKTALIRLDAVKLLEAAENAKFYYYDAKNNKSALSPPGKGGIGGGGGARSVSAPAPRTGARDTAEPIIKPAAKKPARKLIADEEEENAMNNSTSAFADAAPPSKPAEIAAKKKVTVVVPAATNTAASPAAKASATGAAAAIATTSVANTVGAASARQPRFATSRAEPAGSEAVDNAPQTQKATSERGALLSRRKKPAEEPPAREAPQQAKAPVAEPEPVEVGDDEEMINPKTGKPMTAWQRASALEAAAKEKKAVGSATVATAAAAKASAFRAPQDSEGESEKPFDEDKIVNSDEEREKKKKSLFGSKKTASASAEKPPKKPGILERAAARFKKEDNEYAHDEKRKHKAKQEQKKKAKNSSSEESESDGSFDPHGYGGYDSDEAALRAIRHL